MLLPDLTADDEQCSTWDWPQISTDYNTILLKERRDSDVTQPANTHWVILSELFFLIDINEIKTWASAKKFSCNNLFIPLGLRRKQQLVWAQMGFK